MTTTHRAGPRGARRAPGLPSAPCHPPFRPRRHPGGTARKGARDE